jgi:hypothetical protein
LTRWFGKVRLHAQIVQEGSVANETGASVMDEIVRDGARQMLAAVLRAEVAAYVDTYGGDVDDHGRRWSGMASTSRGR